MAAGGLPRIYQSSLSRDRPTDVCRALQRLARPFSGARSVLRRLIDAAVSGASGLAEKTPSQVLCSRVDL